MHRFHESNRCISTVDSSRVDRVYPAVEPRTAQRGCRLNGTSRRWCCSWSALLAPTWVSPDCGSVHTRRPASRIMDPISAAGGGTDGALVPSASSASSVDLATISSSSLASKASGDQNFLDSKVKAEQAAAGGAAPVLTWAQQRKATVPVRSSEVWQGGVPGVKRGFPTSPHSKSLHANLKQRRL